MKSILKILFSILFGIVLLEVGLRITGKYKSYTEKIGLNFSTFFNYSHEGHYYILPINEEVTYENQEFTTTFNTNFLGMRNDHVELTPPDSFFRIICLGDSYTEGDGASNGMDYPRQLERILREQFNKPYYEVLNAGRCGSDIVYAEKILTQQLHFLSPHMIILCINETDVDDIILRGGLERFKPNGTTKYNPGPKYLPIYEHVHIFRMVVHVIMAKDWAFLNKKERIEETKKALETIISSIERIKTFTEEKGIKLVTIIHPVPSDDFSKNTMKDGFKNPTFCEEKNRLVTLASMIYIYDLCPSLEAKLSHLPYTDYAWPINRHFNDYGYKIMTEAIFEIIKEDFEGVSNQIY